MIEDRIEVNIAGGLDIELPRMVDVRQKFDAVHLGDIAATVANEFQRPEVRARVKAGQAIAVGCGSRGIANIATIVKCVIRELQALGARPFIFPAMGSHGAATAEGQKKVLEGYGITEASTGVPVRATMDTAIVGKLDDGTPVHMDRFAAEADGVVVINRIKPHTAFRGATESGITKMLAIGIGKIVGAATYHQHGMDTFPELLPKVRDVNLAARNVLFGVGIVENAHDQTSAIELIPSERIAEREPVLQDMAKKLMPQLFFDEIDVLIIDEMGKNISGAGFDPNITGRNRRAVQWNYGPLTKNPRPDARDPWQRHRGGRRGHHHHAPVPRNRHPVHLRQHHHFDEPGWRRDPHGDEYRARGHPASRQDRGAGEAAGLPHCAHQEHSRTGTDPGFRTAAGGSTRPSRPFPDRLSGCALGIRRARSSRPISPIR